MLKLHIQYVNQVASGHDDILMKTKPDIPSFSVTHTTCIRTAAHLHRAVLLFVSPGPCNGHQWSHKSASSADSLSLQTGYPTPEWGVEHEICHRPTSERNTREALCKRSPIHSWHFARCGCHLLSLHLSTCFFINNTIHADKSGGINSLFGLKDSVTKGKPAFLTRAWKTDISCWENPTYSAQQWKLS